MDGGELVIASDAATGEVLGLAFFRCYRCFGAGERAWRFDLANYKFYVDELVADGNHRSQVRLFFSITS